MQLCCLNSKRHSFVLPNGNGSVIGECYSLSERLRDESIALLDESNEKNNYETIRFKSEDETESYYGRNMSFVMNDSWSEEREIQEIDRESISISLQEFSKLKLSYLLNYGIFLVKTSKNNHYYQCNIY